MVNLGIHIPVPWMLWGSMGGDSPFGNMCFFPKSGWEDDVPPFSTGGIIRTRGNFAGIQPDFGTTTPVRTTWGE